MSRGVWNALGWVGLTGAAGVDGVSGAANTPAGGSGATVVDGGLMGVGAPAVEAAVVVVGAAVVVVGAAVVVVVGAAVVVVGAAVVVVVGAGAWSAMKRWVVYSLLPSHTTPTPMWVKLGSTMF